MAVSSKIDHLGIDRVSGRNHEDSDMTPRSGGNSAMLRRKTHAARVKNVLEPMTFDSALGTQSQEKLVEKQADAIIEAKKTFQVESKERHNSL